MLRPSWNGSLSPRREGECFFFENRCMYTKPAQTVAMLQRLANFHPCPGSTNFDQLSGRVYGNGLDKPHTQPVVAHEAALRKAKIDACAWSFSRGKKNRPSGVPGHCGKRHKLGSSVHLARNV